MWSSLIFHEKGLIGDLSFEGSKITKIKTDNRKITCRCAIARTGGFLTRRIQVLYTIAVILVVLWLVGLLTSYTLGGFIHALLVIAIIVIVIQVIQGRRG